MFKRLLSDRRGTSAVEFGLVAPILLVGLACAADVGLAFSQRQHVGLVAEAAAQYGASNLYHTGCIGCAEGTPASWREGVQAAMRNAFGDERILIYASDQSCGCTTGNPYEPITYSAGYGARTVDGAGFACIPHSCANGADPGHFFTVTASIPYHPVVPWSLIGNGPLTAEAVARVD